MPHARPLAVLGLALAALGLLPAAGEAAPATGYRPWPAAGRPSARVPVQVPPRQATLKPVFKQAPAKPAAPKAGSEAAAGEKPASPPSAAWTAAEGERACFRGRRKLWDGEGWVVKKVSVCP